MPPPELPPRYLALSWASHEALPTTRISQLIADLARHGMRVAIDEPGMLVLTRVAGSIPIHTNVDRSLVVLGNLFDRRATENFAPRELVFADWSDQTPDAAAACLIREAWGSYVALWRDHAGHRHMALRDPSGALPAYHGRIGNIAVLADDLAPWLFRCLGERAPSIDWQAVGGVLAHVPSATHRSLLTGITKLIPGELVDLGEGRAVATLWQPAIFAADAPARDLVQAERLRNCVSWVLNAWLKSRGSSLLELSGGLDSAIVAGTITPLSGTPSLACINYAPPTSAGDERTLARLVAARAQVSLIEAPAEPGQFHYDRLLLMAARADPRLAWLDMIQDAVTPATARSLGACSVMTGQGGDALFFQFPTARVVADLVRDKGLHSPWPRALVEAAHRSRTSIWGGLAELMRTRAADKLAPSASALGVMGSRGRAIVAAGVSRHPWEDQADDLSPGKRLQISALANCQLFHGPSWQEEEIELIHPLLSQPLLELCLSIPTYVLAQGPLDRGLARAAFARWLPDAVRRRVGKGDASTYYSRAVVQNLSFLRSLLLDGVLVQQGILDPEALDTLLDEGTLVQSSDYGAIVLSASLEAWARAWS